jgi:NADH:ubiquinone oxidoreductase subunit B-like Fe-S oxidoreductase
VPGCPPRPESLIDAVLKIQQIIDGQAKRHEFTRPSEMQPAEAN